MKIIYFYQDAWEKTYAEPLLSDHTVIFRQGPVQDSLLQEDSDAEAIAIFVDSQVNTSILERLPHLKLIVARSTGFDNIDLTITQERNIAVCNVPSYGEHTVAEFTFALLLAITRKIYPAYKQVEETGSFATTTLEGIDLTGKTLGVLGTGHIGQNVIRIAQGFNMNVVAFDRFSKPELAKELNFTYLSLNELLQQADIITIHLPYTPETHHLLNKEAFATVKPGAYLINTARGAIIETDALVEALQNNIIVGAGLDVLEEENYMSNETALLSESDSHVDQLKTVLENHYLIAHPNVIITPHNAFNTIEAKRRIVDITIDNIKNFVAGTITNTVKVK